MPGIDGAIRYSRACRRSDPVGHRSRKYFSTIHAGCHSSGFRSKSSNLTSFGFGLFTASGCSSPSFSCQDLIRAVSRAISGSCPGSAARSRVSWGSSRRSNNWRWLICG